MTTTSPFRQTTLMGWGSTADSYVPFDKPIYSPHRTRPTVLFVTNMGSLQSDEVSHLIDSQKDPMLIDLKTGTKCTKQLLVQFFFFKSAFVCGWAGFTKQGRIITYALLFYLIAK